MFAVFGLGNPGREYENTRHNVGFVVVDALAGTDVEWEYSKYGQGEYVRQTIGGEEVEFIKPHTFMNKSGETVAYVQKKHDLTPHEIIVIHDDLDVPIGTFKISHGRGAGGNNGVSSIIQTLKTKEFTRIRIGISPRGEDGRAKRPSEQSDRSYVLGRFTPEEQEEIDVLIPKVENALEMIVGEGREKAMNRFN